MEFKFERTNRGVWFIKIKNCYFVKFNKTKNCFGCALDDNKACYNLSGSILLKKTRI